jgi:hypothetical protein
MPQFPNLARRIADLDNPTAHEAEELRWLDDNVKAEIEAAGLQPLAIDDIFRRGNGEVPTRYIAAFPDSERKRWIFRRAWRYWVCEGPGIPAQDAIALHRTHGKVVRVAGHCGCPDPVEWFKGLGVGLYHVDSSEGLAELVSTINRVVARYAEHTPIKAENP